MADPENGRLARTIERMKRRGEEAQRKGHGRLVIAAFVALGLIGMVSVYGCVFGVVAVSEESVNTPR